MAEKTAQELFVAARARLAEAGQHGIAYDFDKAWIQARVEHAAGVQAALDKQATELAAGTSVILHDDETGEGVVVPIEPEPGAPGEGGGASSAAGSDSKEPLPGGVIA